MARSRRCDANLCAVNSIEWLEPRRLLAAAGRFDPFFGEASGFTNVAFGNADASVLALNQQPDGRTYAVVNAAELVADENGDFTEVPTVFLQRFRRDGTRDTNFGNGGAVRVDLDNPHFIHAEFDSLGRPILRGQMNDTPYGLARLTLDGALDPTFGGGDGVISLDDEVVPNFDAQAFAAAPGGKIVVVTSEAAADNVLLIARLNDDGSLDASFGDGGLVRRRFATDRPPGFSVDTPTAVATDRDGSVLVAAFHRKFSDPGGPTVVARFGPTGEFVAAQTLSTDPELQIGSLNVGGDGRIVATISRRFGGTGPGSILIARLQPNMLWDPTFGDNGKLELSFPDTSSAAEALQQSDGKVLLLYEGDAAIAEDRLAGVTRFNADGSRDLSFGVNGIVDQPIDPFDEPFRFTSPAVERIALGQDGSVLLGGSVSDQDSGRDRVYRDLQVSRVWRDESPVATASLRDVKRARDASLVITVEYRSPNDFFNDGIATFDNRDLRVTGPNGFVRYAKFDRVGDNWLTTSGSDPGDPSPPGPSSQIFVRYKLPAPSGNWDFADNGTYAVRLVGGAVNPGKDPESTFVPPSNIARTLGTFRVRIAKPAQAAASRSVKLALHSEENDVANDLECLR